MKGRQHYTCFPNAALEDLAGGDYTLAETRILLILYRFTVGFHRDRCRFAVSKLAAATGLSKGGVHKALSSLLERQVVERVESGAAGTVYRFPPERQGYGLMGRQQSSAFTPVNETRPESERRGAVSVHGREPEKEKGFKETNPPSCSGLANVGQRATERTGEGRIGKTKHLEQLLAANPTTYDLLLEVSGLEAQDPTPGELDRRARHLLALAQDRTWAAVRHGLQQALGKTGLDNPYGFAVWMIRESPGRPPPPAPKPTKGQAPTEPPPQLSDRAREVARSFRPDAHGRRDYAGMAAALKELEGEQ